MDRSVVVGPSGTGEPPRCIEMMPGVPGILSMGRNAVDEGRLDEAVAWFDTALAVDPAVGAAHLCRGACLARLGRHGRALPSLRRAVELDQDDPVAWLELARAEAVAGDHAVALRVVEGLVASCPDLADTIVEDEAFSGLGDHPRFLAATGRL